MNLALGACKLFLFFVSTNSLQSNMVKLEWQNAVMRAASSDMKIIPVKLDACLMPAILLQTLYINLYGEGIEVALRQIVDIAQGNPISSRWLQQFHNLRAYAYKKDDITVVECCAEVYLEPISNFLFLIANQENELLSYGLRSGSGICCKSFYKDFKLNDGSIHNALITFHSAY